MKSLSVLSAALAAATVLGTAPALQAAEPGMTMWFADQFATGYYLVDKQNHRVVTVTEPGPNAGAGAGGNYSRGEVALADGQQVAFSIEGHGRNALTATLEIERKGDDMLVDVTTETHEIKPWMEKRLHAAAVRAASSPLPTHP